jgi:hypothetical protein
MYIGQTTNPYGSLYSTHVIKYNTLLSLLKVFGFDLNCITPRTYYRKTPFTVFVQPITSATLSSTKPNRLISQHRLSYC